MRQTLYIYIQKGPHWTCGRCYVLIFRKGYSWRWYQLPQTYCQSNVIGQPPTVHVDVVSKHFQNGCLSDYPAKMLLAKYRRIQLCLRRSMVDSAQQSSESRNNTMACRDKFIFVTINHNKLSDVKNLPATLATS